MKREKVSTIQKCLQNNIPLEVIVNITGFSQEEINLYALNGKE